MTSSGGPTDGAPADGSTAGSTAGSTVRSEPTAAERRPKRGAAANPAPLVAARVRVRFAKRGRMRFLSHRDVARAFEWAVRRAALPVAHSHGFSPHPRLSWAGAAPTGAASEAEYVEIGLTRCVEPGELHRALDAALPPGLDLLDVVPAAAETGSLAGRIDGSEWRIELPGVDAAALRSAVDALLAATDVIVERPVKDGTRPVNVRAALCTVALLSGDRRQTVATRAPVSEAGCAIIRVVMRQTTPAVRPDDVLGALQLVAGLRPPVPARATRLAQGLLDEQGGLADPLEPDREIARAEPDGIDADPSSAAGR